MHDPQTQTNHFHSYSLAGQTRLDALKQQQLPPPPPPPSSPFSSSAGWANSVSPRPSPPPAPRLLPPATHGLMGCRLSRHPPEEMSMRKERFDDDERVEHISDRQDHIDHEIQVLQSILPKSSAPSPPSRKLSRSASRRFSTTEDDLEPLELSNARKFNSTSTLFVDSTVSSPDLEETLRCVALAISYIIQDGHKQEKPKLYSDKFDEKTFPLTDGRVRKDYASRIPSEDRIFKFMYQLFHSAQLTAECGIITLVYINRIIAYTGLALHASTWKRVLLGAILMASKVWDDQAVWNVDFCSMLPNVHVDDMNDLERTFLEMLDFNIDVDSSVYAKYYFELRALAEKFDKDFPLKPLNKEQAGKLEAFSERRHDVSKGATLRSAQSLDSETFRAKAIIS
eukprot:m.229761 g.229761  ORF g.229761 m.229761 type:complete len:397 (-) comp17056_c6_seq2:701-1891(-)